MRTQAVHFVKVDFLSFNFISGHTKECIAMHGLGSPLTVLIGWCGRLSVHDSSLSVYGPTRRLELPDDDSPHSY